MISLLSAAAELEHGSACAALFAAASLKLDVCEGALTDEQAELAGGWKRSLLSVGSAGLGRVEQLANLLTAVGGTPQLQPPDDALSPFSSAAIGSSPPGPGPMMSSCRRLGSRPWVAKRSATSTTGSTARCAGRLSRS